LQMSPAARRLATHGLGIRLSSDKELKASYTPSPSRTPRSMRFTHTPGSSRIVVKTPKRSAVEGAVTPAAAETSSSTSITDNLLSFGQAKIAQKTRPSASDFF
uniref:R3H domain-containing protein n=1 Tax=Gongylonema pulchrum TaxID=637853 RepID=A0A183EQD6_9BILA